MKEHSLMSVTLPVMADQLNLEAVKTPAASMARLRFIATHERGPLVSSGAKSRSVPVAAFENTAA